MAFRRLNRNFGFLAATLVLLAGAPPHSVHASSLRPAGDVDSKAAAAMKSKKLRQGVTDPTQVRLRGVGGPLALGALALQSLGSLSGCAASRSAGDSCYEVEFTPDPETYPDSAFKDIRERCRLDRVSSWNRDSGPELSSACQQAIADLLPLGESLRNPTGETEKEVRSKVIRAFHTLLFFPVADDASIFGSVSDRDYCGNVYGAYLGADGFESTVPVDGELTGAGYDSGYGQMNLHLVRFILERVDELRFLDANQAKGRLAQGSGSTIDFSPYFADNYSPVFLASILVHEARHNAEGFPDGSDHVACTSGDVTTDDCDDSMFGAYGAQISYFDAVIRGSLRARLPDGKGILSNKQLWIAVRSACEYYQLRVNVPDGALADTFGTDCADLSSQSNEAGLPSFTREVYGIEYSEIPFR